MLFKLACAQFAPQKGKLGENLDRIASLAIRASESGADHILFPEACVSGYFLEGGVNENALEASVLMSELQRRLSGLKRSLDVSVGFFELLNGDIYNSVATYEFADGNSKIVNIYRKFFLATYGVFDDERFVSRGTELGVFQSRLGKFGVLICEDVWHSILPTLCALKGAEVMLIASASPARGFSGEMPSNLDRYQRMVRGVCEEQGVFAANAMLCGFEGGKGLVGGSLIADPYGRFLAEGPIQEEYLLVAEIDTNFVAAARQQTPLLSDLRSHWSDLTRIIAEIEP